MIKVQLPNNQIAEFPDDMPHEAIEGVLQKQFPGQPTGADKMRGLSSQFDTTVGTIPQGIKEGLLRAKAGWTGEEAPKFQDLPGDAGTGQYIGQTIGQPLGGSIPLGAAGGAAFGPVGALAGGLMGAFGGTPGNISERTGEALTEMAIPVGGAVAGTVGKRAVKELNPLRNIGTLLKDTNPHKTLEKVVDRHDSLKSTANELYEHTFNQAKERGVKPLELGENTLGKIEGWLSDTEANKKLIQRAEKGDLKAIHEIQSDLNKKAYQNRNAASNADRNLGDEQREVVKKIQNQMGEHLQDTGNTELTQTYDLARNLYRDLMDTYYKPKGISDIFDAETRLIPDNIVEKFSTNTKPMREFLDKHPEMKELLDIESIKKETAQALKKLGIAGGGALGASEAINMGKKAFSGD